MKLDNKEKLIWEVSTQTQLPPVPDKDAVWDRLVQEMKIDQNNFGITKKESSWKLWPNMGNKINIAIAYGLIFALLSPLAYNFFFTKNFLTGNAQNETVLLSDGTKIILNSKSKIIYGRNYNIDNRSIKLTGEAYFEVEKNDLPFTIETAYGVISVLGTSFNVRSREDGFEVGVNDGRIKLSNESYSIHLSKGQFIEVESSFEEKDIVDISIKEYPDWINQKFYCNETRLDELCSEIERTFDIQIKFLDQNLKNLTITGIIEASDLNDVLYTVSLLTKHKFKLEDDICTIL